MATLPDSMAGKVGLGGAVGGAAGAAANALDVASQQLARVQTMFQSWARDMTQAMEGLANAASNIGGPGLVDATVQLSAHIPNLAEVVF
jgi:hypothetical protein